MRAQRLLLAACEAMKRHGPLRFAPLKGAERRLLQRREGLVWERMRRRV